MKHQLDRAKLIGKLDRVKYEKEEDEKEDPFGKLKLSEALLAIAQINHEHEYHLCRKVAEHLLGSVPKPEDVGPDE